MVDSVWSKPDNWSQGSPPSITDDVEIGLVAGTEGTRVTLDINDTFASLLLTNGNELSTENFELVVNGVTVLKNANTRLLIKNNGTADSFDTEGLTVNDGTTVQMLGGILEIESGILDSNTGGRLEGYGRIDFDTTAAIAWSNNADIFVGNSLDGSFPIADVARTLTINTAGGGTLDLDNGGTVTIGRAGTFDINGTINDAVSNTWEMFANSTLDVSTSWSHAGNLNINTEAGFFAGQPAGTATIAGGTFSLTGGAINLNHADDHLVLDSAFNATATGGTLNLTRGRITFNGPATVGPTVDVTMGTSTEIDVNSTVNVSNDWNWDGNGGPDNVITIGDFGRLNAGNSTTPLTEPGYSGNLNINGGTLNVQAVGDEWAIDSGTTTVGGTTTSLFSGDAFRMAGGTLVVDPGATLAVSSAARLDAGTITVNGLLDLNGGTELLGSLITGPGQLDPGTTTVTGTQNVGVATYNWDTGTHTLNPGSILTLNVSNVDTAGSDQVNSVTHVNSAMLTVTTLANEWQLGTAGDLNLTNSGAGIPTLRGDTLRLVDGGRIDIDGDALVEASLILEEGLTPGNGTVLNVTGVGGAVSFEGVLSLNGGDILDDIDRSAADAIVSINNELIVTGDSTINVKTFDWEGESPIVFERGTTTVMPGGTLRILSAGLDSRGFGGSVPDNGYAGRLRIESGTVHVDLSDHSSWHSDLSITLENSDDTPPVLTGDLVEIGDGKSSTNGSQLNVIGTGVSQILAPIRFRGDTNLQISANASLYLGSITTFDSQEPDGGPGGPIINGSFSGAGMLLLGGTTHFEKLTRLEVATVDLDGGPGDVLGNNVNINNRVTIDANQLEDFGNANLSGVNVLNINAEDFRQPELLVITGNDTWTITSEGVLNFNGRDGLANPTISGRSVNVEGIVNVDKTAVMNAPLLISGTLNVPDADDIANLIGASQILGGLITGQGRIAGRLRGYGEINSVVDVPNIEGSSGLLADDGTLHVNGAIVAVGRIGTADEDGVLNIANPWQTSVADEVLLAGGELTGAIITNDLPDGIQGSGLISAPVINNTQLAALSGTLTVGTSAINTDFDGASNVGVLDATSGSMTLRQDDVSFNFGGTINIGAAFFGAHALFVDGFSLVMDPGSVIHFTGGRLRSGTNQTFNGLIDVRETTAEIDAPAMFGATSTVDLGFDLRLEENTVIEDGATFTGTGDLVLGSAVTLTLEDGVSIGTNIDNFGILSIGLPTGAATLAELLQRFSAEIQMELGGLVPESEYDRLIINGNSTLDGILNVALIGGFLPSLGDSFDLFDWGPVSGSFDTINLPTLGGGLDWDTSHLLIDGTLSVVSTATSGDFNSDGFWNCTDIDALVAAIAGGSTDLTFDMNGDGTVTAADITDENVGWLAVGGANNPADTGGNPFLVGDASLDGTVDGVDLLVWNASKFTDGNGWCGGDFNADGTTDGPDFLAWSTNKFTSSDNGSAVPEPGMSMIWFLVLGGLVPSAKRRAYGC